MAQSTASSAVLRAAIESVDAEVDKNMLFDANQLTLRSSAGFAFLHIYPTVDAGAAAPAIDTGPDNCGYEVLCNRYRIAAERISNEEAVIKREEEIIARSCSGDRRSSAPSGVPSTSAEQQRSLAEIAGPIYEARGARALSVYRRAIALAELNLLEKTLAQYGLPDALFQFSREVELEWDDPSIEFLAADASVVEIGAVTNARSVPTTSVPPHLAFGGSLIDAGKQTSRTVPVRFIQTTSVNVLDI